MNHLTPGLFQIGVLVLHCFLFLLQLLNDLDQFLSLFNVLLFKLHNLFFCLPELLLSMVVFFLVVLLVIPFGSDLLDMLLVVLDFLLQPDDPVIVLLL